MGNDASRQSCFTTSGLPAHHDDEHVGPVRSGSARSSISGAKCTSVAQAMKFDDGYFVTPLPTPTNLAALVRGYRKVEGVRHKVVVEEIGFDESLVVTADARIIKTVLDELVAHADGRSPARASIWLSVELKRGNDRGKEDQFAFRVVDNGQKMDESRDEKVFHNYWLGDGDALERVEEGGNNNSVGGSLRGKEVIRGNGVILVE